MLEKDKIPDAANRVKLTIDDIDAAMDECRAITEKMCEDRWVDPNERKPAITI